MKLKGTVTVDIGILHITGNVISVCMEESILYDVESEEYKTLCERYVSKIGYLREDSPDTFDKDMLAILTDVAKNNLKCSVDRVIDGYREAVTHNMYGVIELFGWIFKMSDISGIHVVEYNINMSKKE